MALRTVPTPQGSCEKMGLDANILVVTCVHTLWRETLARPAGFMTISCYSHKTGDYRWASRKNVSCVGVWGTVIIGRARGKFPACARERDWVTVVHQHSFKQIWHIRVTLYLETHTGEPCEACAHRRSSVNRAQTHMRDLPGKNTHKQ